MSDHELREVVANCCGDDADPCLSCRQVQRGIDTIERLERELAEAKAAMSRCLLGDPPGDCYAAESITQRVRAERYRKAIDDYLEGNYPCPSAYRGKLGGKCPHGTYYWEECEGCNTEHFEAALKEPSDALGEEDNAAGE